MAIHETHVVTHYYPKIIQENDTNAGNTPSITCTLWAASKCVCASASNLVRAMLKLLDEKKKKKKRDQIELHIHHVVKPFNLRTRVSVFTHPPVVSYTCTICYSGLDSCFLRSFFPILEVAGFFVLFFFPSSHIMSHWNNILAQRKKKFW